MVSASRFAPRRSSGILGDQNGKCVFASLSTMLLPSERRVDVDAL